MNTLVIISALLALANASAILPAAKILQGPSTKTTVVGPDGSAISAIAPGGQIITEQYSGAVAYAAPFVTQPASLAYAAPAVAHYAHPAPVAYGAPLARAVLPAAYGLQGQYLHDYTEKLYDDGSYKPELTPVPLAASPLGLTVAGSGLEGQYVHDFTEKLYDDGSYKPGLYY